jgi:plasmid stabilization system protein ParE
VAKGRYGSKSEVIREGFRLVESEILRKTSYDYLIFYRITGDTVEIIHVVHGSRDYSKLP